MAQDERPSKKRRLSTEIESESAGSKRVSSSATVKLDDPTDNAAISTSNHETNIDVLGPPHDDPKDSTEDAANGNDEASLPTPSTTAPFASALLQDSTQPPLSKNQQKKLAKKASWEAKREDRKLLRKEKAVAKRERRREERQAREAETVALGLPVPPPGKPRPQRAVTLPVTVLIDCDFDDLMRDNERISLAGQITRSYSDNKNALFRSHLGVCSFGGRLRERFENVLGHHKGWKGVRFVDEPFIEAAEIAKGWMRGEKMILKGAFEDQGTGSSGPDASDAEDVRAKLEAESEVVYLSSESPYTLDRLKPYSTYIIGGLVDKNREKGICYKRAVAAGVKTAKLPIGEFMDMQSRKVLATNHVNEIMVKWLECGDWGEAFLKVIPKRKGGALKGRRMGKTGEEDAGAEGEEAESVDTDADDEDDDGDMDADHEAEDFTSRVESDHGEEQTGLEMDGAANGRAFAA